MAEHQSESDKIFTWRRPDNAPYPNVWHQFEIKLKNGQNCKVKIQDITPNRFEDCLDFMDAVFDHYEPMCRSIQVWNLESTTERKKKRKAVLEQKASLIATIDENNDIHGNPKIIGVLMTFIASRNDPQIKKKEKKTKSIADLLDTVRKDTDPFQILNSDKYISDIGLAVSPEYTGKGVGFQLFSCIPRLGKAWHIVGSMSIFTSVQSQRIADKLGYELCNELRYDEYKDEHGQIILPVVGTPTIKLMFLKFQK